VKITDDSRIRAEEVGATAREVRGTKMKSKFPPFEGERLYVHAIRK
jgi:hypothetical protein